MMAVSRKLRNFWELPPPDRRLFLEAAFALPSIALALRLVRMNALFDHLGGLADRWAQPMEAEDTSIAIRRTQRLLALAAWRGAYRGNCLSRSATLWWLLRRQGIPSALRIGVRKEDGALDAHAWVECDGVAINDRTRSLRRYTPFEETLTQ
jgi:hypothetical protein